MIFAAKRRFGGAGGSVVDYVTTCLTTKKINAFSTRLGLLI
jgi:hypothetical protein